MNRKLQKNDESEIKYLKDDYDNGKDQLKNTWC